MKHFITVFFLFLGLSGAFAQLSTDYKIENVTELGYIYETYVDGSDIYYFGITADTNNIQFSFRKIDTLGNVVWSTSDHSNTLGAATDGGDPLYDLFSVDKIIDDGSGFLYAVANTSVFSTEGILMKVSKATGEVIYSSWVPNDKNYNPFVLNNDSLALMNYEQGGLKVNYYNKHSGNYLGNTTLFNPNTGSAFYIHGIQKDTLDNLYLADVDTIRKLNAITNQEIWKSPISQVEVRYIRHILLSSTENSLYAFGITDDIPTKTFIAKLDRVTGAEIWSTSFLLPFNWSLTLNPKAIKGVEYGNKIAGVFQNHSDNTFMVLVDSQNGSTIWSSQNDHVKNLENIQVADTKLLLLGDSGYTDGRLRVVSIDLNMGASLDTFIEPPVDFYSNTVGAVVRREMIGAVPLSNKIILIGNGQLNSNKTYEFYAEVSSDDLSLIQHKPLGGNYQLHSDTKLMASFPNGNVIKATEVGRYVNFELTDPYGQPIWEKDYGIIDDSYITSFESSQLDYLDVIGDTVFIVKVRNRSIYEYSSENGDDWVVEDLLFFFSINGELLNVLNLGTDIEVDNIDVDWMYDATNDHYIILFHTAYFVENDGTLIHTLGISSTNDPAFVGSKRLHDINEEMFLYVDNDRTRMVEKFSSSVQSPTATSVAFFSVGALQYVNAVNDSILLACFRNTNTPYSINWAKIEKASGNVLSTNTSFKNGSPYKWLKTPNPNIVLAIHTNANRDSLFYTRYNFETEEILSSILIRASPNNERIYLNDIVLNKNEDRIFLAGYEFSNLFETKILIIATDIFGNKLLEVVDDGAFPGRYNQATKLMTHPLTGDVWAGGMYNHPTLKKTAFVSRFDGNYLNVPINGSVFFDENANGIKDSLEINVPVGEVVMDGTFTLYLNQNGLFEPYATNGWTSFSYQLPSDWELTTDGILQFHPTFSNQPIQFGVIPLNIVDSISTSIAATTTVCNNTSQFTILINNEGTTFQTPELTFKHKGDSIHSPSIMPENSTDSTMTWILSPMAPGSNQVITVSVEMPGADFLGDTLRHTATVFYTPTGQSTIDSSLYTYEHILLCSYDPNDKQVDPQGSYFNDTSFVYTIRFQNTGNYPAQHVVITDTLSNNLDLSTFDFLMASHPVSEVIRDGNVVNFKFYYIYLPDSLSNEPESHGFVQFRINSKAGLAEGATIENTAHIYFDENPAIVTNTTENTYSIFTSTKYFTEKEYDYKIFPNPTNGILTIQQTLTHPKFTTWSLINITGEVIDEGALGDTVGNIDFNHLQNGVYFLKINNSEIHRIILLK